VWQRWFRALTSSADLSLGAFFDAGWVRQWKDASSLQLRTPTACELAGYGMAAGLSGGPVQVQAWLARPGWQL